MTDKGLVEGAHRTRTPEQTWAAFEQAFAQVGITRLARVTDLDRIGIPVFCAIRPTAKTLQVSNGKGTTDSQAKVSAAMESAELWHAEQHADRFELATPLAMGVDLEEIRRHQGFVDDCHIALQMPLRWSAVEDLVSGSPHWALHDAVYASGQGQVAWTSNGLASGNTTTEATIHAICEVIERDSIARLRVHGRLRLKRSCKLVRRETVGARGIAWMWDRITAEGCTLHLLWVPSRAPLLSTFWAFVVDPHAVNRATRINYGFGTHLSPQVAASRAISEAAQSRLTFIHGAREDLASSAFDPSASVDKIQRFFSAFEPEVAFDGLADPSRPSLEDDLDAIIDALRQAGLHQIYRADLSRPNVGIPVVKVLVPGTSISYRYH